MLTANICCTVERVRYSNCNEMGHFQSKCPGIGGGGGSGGGGFDNDFGGGSSDYGAGGGDGFGSTADVSANQGGAGW